MATCDSAYMAAAESVQQFGFASVRFYRMVGYVYCWIGQLTLLRTLILTRHGQSEWNKLNLVCGLYIYSTVHWLEGSRSHGAR